MEVELKVFSRENEGSPKYIPKWPDFRSMNGDSQVSMFLIGIDGRC